MNRKRIALISLGIVALLLLVIVVAGSYAWQQFNFYGELAEPVTEAVEDFRFDLLRYEVDAISNKLYDWWRRPGVRLMPEEQIKLVEQYRWRAQRLGWIEHDIGRIYADPDVTDPESASASLRQQLDDLAVIQEKVRPLVEAIMERQVADGLNMAGLASAGLIWPPVRFNFSDLPNYLIVSPRERIEVEAGVHLRSDLGLPEIEAIEEDVAIQFDRSTLIDDLGGLGVWPTMVMDDSSISWTLNTIAHEWVHNYLAFQPLGWSMFDNREMNIINETVASIVGDEIGQAVAYKVYGIPLPPPPSADEIELPEPDPDEFDFRTEMRRTRLKVDELLEAGQVVEAEDYMELRRQLFVENGYAIRKLNQAYFAFHGNYATRPAASDPIGPKLLELRSLTPDLATFFHAVQEISEPEDLDRLLAAWRGRIGAGVVAPAGE